ncbi:MAG: hypothetical protein BIFFINMI_02295 [Phycisphaerae bacterium]|nr:hypothetical protein [Phycisphaerae bacterium]
MDERQLRELIERAVRETLAAGCAPSSAPPETRGSGGTGKSGAASSGGRQNDADKSTDARRPKASARGSGEKKKSFITADDLRKRVGFHDAGPRELELADNEFLTPAAQDEARRLNVTVTRHLATVAQPLEPQRRRREPTTQPPSAATPPIGLVVDAGDAKVQAVLSAWARTAKPADFNRSACWMQNLVGLCRAVADGQARGGVALLRSAGEALVLANKVPGVRAVAARSAEELASAAGRFAPNVLVLAHPALTLHEIRALLSAFAPAQAGADIGLMGMIGRLEGK